MKNVWITAIALLACSSDAEKAEALQGAKDFGQRMGAEHVECSVTRGAYVICNGTMKDRPVAFHCWPGRCWWVLDQ